MEWNHKKGELLVLKDKFDDKNYKRVYEVTKIMNNNLEEKIFVKAISEKSQDPERYPEKSDKSLIGKELGPFEANLFNPYL